MKDLLFSARGRITRAQFWMSMLLFIVVGAIVGVLSVVLWQVIPGESVDGEFKVDGVKAIPYLVLLFGYLVFCVWAGICVAIKRFHDRDKSGAWVLIQLVPIIGPIWYFVEAGCLRGTVGPNRYGPDPLSGSAASPVAYGRSADFRGA